VFPRPSYPLFEPLAALESVVPAHYRLGYDGEWHLDLDSLTGALRPRTRAVCLVQPNHPTGSCLSASELEAVESLCERHHLTLVSDEVFGDFPWAPSAPLPTLAGRTRVPTFVLSGLSKVAGLPHMKLSWIVLSGPAAERDQWLEGLEWIADLFLSVGAPVQSALPGLLESRHGFQERVARRLALNLGQLDASVKRCPEMSRLNASGGWHAVLRLPARRTSEEWAIELLRRDVRIHPGSFYDLEAEAHLVASLIVTPAAFAAGLDQIEALVRED
jgi:alanine-synthesizing transaminase